MSVSTRFRDISKDVAEFLVKLEGCGEDAGSGKQVVKGVHKELVEWTEQVGEIPRMKLEFTLTPVLLKVHNSLDRARLIFEENDLDNLATTTWDLQQQIYRLLNDL